MSVVGRLARAISGAVGRESAAIRALRPAYNWMLHAATLGRGIWWTVNGRERYRIDPFLRQYFPPEYDPMVHAFLRERVRPGSTVFDVGANLGIYALCLAEWAGARGRVFAFEPNPAARAVLAKHVALNRFTGRVTIVGEAISDAAGDATFNAAGIEGYSRLGVENPDLPGGTSITVPVITLDAFCARERLTPDWIILDIEGYEGAALRGARETLQARRGSLGLVVEMHPSLWAASGTSRSAMESLLKDLALRPVPLTGQKDPFAEYGIVALQPAPGT